ncbi:hypothetical protein ABT115_00930 [Streptomyces sp. NPDC001832]|uniref:hypothetical protein n=1 Tax=Streptomyces sp. NPDC001832 TaxID=3154527 RepID=UPI00331E93E3
MTTRCRTRIREWTHDRHPAALRHPDHPDALGAHPTTLAELADLGAENTTPTIAMPAPPGGIRGRTTYGGAALERTPALDLEPQRQTVHAQVNVRFTMSAPKL